MAPSKRKTTRKLGATSLKAAQARRGRSPKAGLDVATNARKRRADGRETRARVLSAAAEVFARDGFEGASLRRIAERAEIDIATLKYHVRDKEALFNEVYQDGYEHFQQALGPLLIRLPLARDRAELSHEIDALLERAYAYFEENQVFVRLWLFRLLEGKQETFQAEEATRSNIITIIEATLAVLNERGLVRVVDARMLVLLLVTAMPTLVLGLRARPGWLGEGADVRARFVAFLGELLRSQLLDPKAN